MNLLVKLLSFHAFVLVNSADPVKTASRGAVCSGSTLLY